MDESELFNERLVQVGLANYRPNWLTTKERLGYIGGRVLIRRLKGLLGLGRTISFERAGLILEKINFVDNPGEGIDMAHRICGYGYVFNCSGGPIDGVIRFLNFINYKDEQYFRSRLESNERGEMYGFRKFED